MSWIAFRTVKKIVASLCENVKCKILIFFFSLKVTYVILSLSFSIRLNDKEWGKIIAYIVYKMRHNERILVYSPFVTQAYTILPGSREYKTAYMFPFEHCVFHLKSILQLLNFPPVNMDHEWLDSLSVCPYSVSDCTWRVVPQEQ